MYDPIDIIQLIGNNVRKTRNPFGIPKFMLNRWWKKADLRRHGDAMLFTGMMYQFVPYIETSTAYLARYEDTKWARKIRMAGYAPSFLAGAGLAAITPRHEKKAYNAILVDIANLLRKSGVDYFYDPALDNYSGVLLYDLGDQEGFIQHAKYVAASLKYHGVKKLITVDPHTTYALKVLFPKYTGAEFEVHAYFELLALESGNGARSVTLHDPCFYGRYLELADAPASVLKKMNIDCMPVENSGLFTHCCGGPAESISPKLSSEIGNRRIQQLTAAEAPIVAMCPVCLANLKKTGAPVEDLASVLARAAR